MRNKKILIVDFDKESLNSLSKYLQDDGFKVATSTDGLAGLEAFLADNPHLVIVEAMLPKLDGFDLCTKITTAFPSRIPVIIISGVYRDSLSKTEALRSCGASAFFAKPVKKEEILSTILNLLKLPGTKQEIEKEKATEREREKPREKEMFSHPQRALEMLSQQSLETFHASPRPDDGRRTKIEEAIEEELQEAITTLGIKPKDKKTKKEAVSPEIDNMLKNTLAEFGGLTAEKRKSAPEPPARVAPRRPEVMAPILVMPAKVPEKKPVSSPKPNVPQAQAAAVPTVEAPVIKMPLPEPPAAQPHPQEDPRREERKSGSTTSPFDKYSEKKKASSSPRFMIFGITALLVMGSAFVFLNLKKRPSPPPHERAAMVMPEVQQTAAGLSAGAFLTGGAERVRSKKEPGQKPLVIRKEAPKVPDVSPDKIEPLLPSAAPIFNIQDQPPTENTAAAQPPPNEQGQANSTQENSPVQEQPANDAPTLPAKIKLGDLVPLEQADTPPQTIGTFEPLYPPLAFQMNVQGTVLLNALISENGGVIQTAILKSPKNYGFEKAAQDAVRKWKFKPATKDGVAVRVWKTISFTFKK